MKLSNRTRSKLAQRVVSQDPVKQAASRLGGVRRASWYGSDSMAAAGQRGGIVKFLRYGSDGMRAMITQYWEDVRAGLRPPPRRTHGKDE